MFMSQAKNPIDTLKEKLIELGLYGQCVEEAVEECKIEFGKEISSAFNSGKRHIKSRLHASKARELDFLDGIEYYKNKYRV